MHDISIFETTKAHEIIVEIDGCTMEIVGCGAQLSRTWLYFVVPY